MSKFANLIGGIHQILTTLGTHTRDSSGRQLHVQIWKMEKEMSDLSEVQKAAEDFAAQGVALINAIHDAGVPVPEEIYPIIRDATMATKSITQLFGLLQAWFGHRDNLVRLGELDAADVDQDGKYTEVRLALTGLMPSAREHRQLAVEAVEAYLHVYPASSFS